MLRKGVLLERTYIHPRRPPLDHSRERPHVSRDPVSLAPRLPPTHPGRRNIPPARGGGLGPRRPEAPRRRPFGAPASGASRAPEIHSVNFAREVHPVTLTVQATRGQTVGSVIPLLSRVSLNVFQPEPDSIASLEVGSSFPLRPGRSHELLILRTFPDASQSRRVRRTYCQT